MNYAEISKETFSSLYKAYESLKASPLDQKLKAMIELLVSQINGCSYCCNLHSKEALKLEVSQVKIKELAGYRTSDLFSEAEKIALAYSESMTTLDGNLEAKSELSKHFTEREIVDITACVGIICAFNRIAINLRE